jgi:hypothetical protein
MPDMGILIGGGVVFLLLVILLIARSRKKADEPQPPVHVPPNPFDKPPTSGPVSTPGPVSGPTSSAGPASGPVSSPMHAGPVSGPISTPGGAPPVSGEISSPGAAKPSDVDALLARDEGTAIMPGAPLRPVDDDDDLRTQAQDRPPVDLDAHEAETAQPPDVASAPPPPAAEPEPVVEAKKPEPAKPAPPKPPPPAARPASDPAVKPPAAPVASKATSPATPAAMADALRKEPARAKLPSKPDVPQDAELDFSALRDAKKSDAKVGVAAPAAATATTTPAAEAKAPAPAAATSPAARFVPASNPETAELEKSDPRHAAARRLARLSVSEIKLYHEAEVKEGREKKDLWKRLLADITLATQTYDKRVDQEVRDRFDYIHDEIVRQLAEGNAELLGADAPKAKTGAKVEAPKPVEAPKADEAKADAKAEAKPEATPSSESSKVTAPAVTRPAGQAPTNPETAELEKSDPRHAAARRLARLSVSEIKLYHEAEVKEGREKKDLYTRLGADIALAKQTFEKRVDQEVRDRFDYLYDEIVRQLAEGNADLLGSGAPPKPVNKAEAKADAPKPAEAPKPVEAPKPEPAKVEAPKSEPKVEAPKPAAAAEPAKPTMPGVKYAPPSNPETADLEKGDPRHAAARRLARLSVSEIKLYHEAEVKEGREKKDLYSRLGADISLAKQTYEKRVDQEVRDRFDYLYDEIVRQLTEGNAELLGKDAPPPPVSKGGAAKPAEAPKPVDAPKPEPAKVEAPKSEPKVEAPKPAAAAEPAKEEPKPVAAPAASAATQPSAIAAKYMAPSNPATAELEKGDPRHAAARRLARLSVSEIKLYHEAEVKEGREKKDLYTRLGADIALAKQTFEKRVDQEVRDRFDYLYDEIVRQLAEGNADLLGSGAPPKPPNN